MGDIVITPASNDVNSTAGTLVLRASDLNPISLRTNDTNRLFIDPTGSVGLGTAVPTGGLHINYAPGAFSEALRLQRNGGVFYSFGLDTNFLNIAYNGNVNANNVLVLTNNGYLGVGNLQNALFNLDVASAYTKGIQLRYDNTTGYRAQIIPYWNTNTDTRIDFAINRVANVAATVMMSVGYDNNVGIGTTQPTYKLDVAGAIAMHDENQDIDSRFYGGTFLRGWSSFFAGSEANITYTTDTTSPVGVEVASVSSYVWARGPKIRLDKTQNYEVELWVKRQTANTAGDFYVVVSNYDNGGNVIAGDGTDWHYPIAVNPLSASWTKYRFIVGPYGGSKDHSPNARYISVGFIANYTTGTDVIYMTGFKCRPIPRYNNDNLTLFNDGRVGIGTTQPTGVLHLYGNTNSWQTSPSIVMASSSTLNANIRNWRIGPADTNYGNFHIGVSDVQGGTVDSNAEAQAFTITYDQKVGIGRIDPPDKLSVHNGNISLSDSYKLYNGSANDSVGLFFSAALQANISAYNGIIFRSSPTNIASQTERMRITSGGNVGVGTNTPYSLLDVQLASASQRYLTLSTNDGQGSLNGFGLNFRIANTDHDIAQIRGDYESSAGGGYGGLFFATRFSGTLYNRVAFNDNGRVGIGVSYATTLLSVGGPGSTVAASGITLGADSVANLYRSQASQIKTDAQLVAVGGFYSSNTSNYLETVNIGTAVIIEGGVNEGLFLGDTSRWYIGTTDAAYTANADGDLHFRDATNSITRMIISYANGNVGIGVTNPIEKLHVFGNIQLSGSSGGSLNINTNNAGNGNISFDGSTFTIVSNSNSAPLIFSTASTERMRIQANGRVGISTNSALAQLHVSGQTYLNNVVANTARNQLTFNANGANYAHFYDVGVSANNALAIGGNGAIGTVPTKAIMSWRLSTENVGIGLTNPEATSALHIKNLDAAAKVTIESADASESYINFSAQSSEYSVGFVRDGSNVNSLRFCAADSLSANEVMRLQNGNVGINTTSPSEKLHVSGNAIIGNSTYGGTYGQYLRFPFGAFDLAAGTLRAYIQFDSIEDYSVNNNDVWKWKLAAVARPGNAGNYNSQLEILRTTRNGVTDFTDFVINRNGNVGIGTTSPIQKLHIVGSTLITNNNYHYGYTVAGAQSNLIGISSADNIIVGQNNVNHANTIIYGGLGVIDLNTSGSTRMRVTYDGNVGIGTNTPTTLLSVGGLGSTSAASGITFGADASANIYRLSLGVLKTDGAFQTSAYFYAGTYVQIANGNIYPGSYTTDLVLNIGNNAATAWDTYPVTIRKGTYVGIGTNIPTGKLHVVSSIAGETVFRADGTNGTLLSVVDDLSDSLFSVNNGAGLPVLEVFADDRIVAGQYGSGDFVLTNNKIGIGTTNPINKLSVIGAASIGSATYNTAAPANGLIVQGIVGIGLTNPTQKLHVKSSVSQDGVMIDALQYSEVAFRVNGSASKSFLALTSIAGGYVVGSSANSFIIRNDTDIFMTADAGATSNITIKNNGNVGIGLTNPSVRLEVLSTAVTIANLGSNQTSQLVYLGNSSATNYSDLIIRSNDGQAEFFRAGNGYGSWGGASALNIYNSNGPIAFHPNATTNAMFLSSAGYLGIGTTVPAEKLDVRGGVVRSNARVTNDQGFPVGHYTPGETVFEIDPTWSQLELQKYFNSASVTWAAVADAPGGYCIYIDGAVNVGGFANSGFPYIPVDTNDIFYMECWIQNVGTNQGHYMGSQEFDHTFANLGGNPGSYGYWVMSNYNPTTTWTKVSGYITGFSNTIGQFKAGTKYWTPQALFNYTAGTGTRACRISGWKVIKVSHVGDRSFTGNVNVASDLYVADELGVGVAIASKRFTYGAQISVASASIQLVLGRTATSAGQGAIGADANNTFAVWNVSGGATRQFSITQQGDVGVGNINPTSRLTIGTNFASVKGISVSTDSFGSSQFVARKDVSKTAYGILAWDTSVYLGAGVYYDGSTWIHHNANNNNQLFAHVPGGGMQWYASNDGSASWNVANAVVLWDDGARWKSSVRATRLEDSYITGGNFALGTDSPTSRLTVLGPALTANTKNTYAAAIGNLNNTDLTFGADGSYAYIQSWGSKPLYINNQGNNVLVNSNVGIGTISPSGRLHVNTDSYSSLNRPFIVNNGVRSVNAKLYDTAVIQQDDVTSLRLVERNTAVANQILSFSIGDDFARIACTAQPMQFYVNGGDAVGDYGYLGLNGTKAIDISTTANVGIGNVTPNAARLHIKGDGSNPVLRVESALLASAAGGTAGKTFVGWLPIQTGALSPGDTVYIPLYK